jgi:hypothetical protein
MAFKSICVFCGSKRGHDPIYAEIAEYVGRYLARNGVKVVYGGGQVGLMGVLADAVLDEGGEIIGVIPAILAEREVAHQGVVDMRILATMQARKALMVEISDAFICLPGGYGTLDELYEALTLRQLSLHTGPCGLLNTKGFFDPVLTMVAHAYDEGFLGDRHKQLVVAADTLPELLERMSVDVELVS